MHDTGLFIAGFLITLPAAAGVIALIYAAVLDGRDNERAKAERDRQDVASR